MKLLQYLNRLALLGWETTATEVVSAVNWAYNSLLDYLICSKLVMPCLILGMLKWRGEGYRLVIIVGKIPLYGCQWLSEWISNTWLVFSVILKYKHSLIKRLVRALLVFILHSVDFMYKYWTYHTAVLSVLDF